MAEIQVVIKIKQNLSLSAQPPDGIVGQPYDHTFQVIGGVLPYVFQLMAPVPPGGWAISTTGRLTGTPTTTQDVLVRIADSGP